RFLVKYPDYKGRFAFLQIGPASRIEIDEYRELNEEIEAMAAEINARHGTGDWRPIHVLKGSYPPSAVHAYFRLADVCVVSSLHDGMNLVAKEFVSARPDGDAVLLLSRFTGAARELGDALKINPYDADGAADVLKQA